jgi:hypothetical protein
LHEIEGIGPSTAEKLLTDFEMDIAAAGEYL